jgi:hypothetical protein
LSCSSRVMDLAKRAEKFLSFTKTFTFDLIKFYPFLMILFGHR